MKKNNAYLSGSKGGNDCALTWANETNGAFSRFDIRILILDSTKPVLQ